jgi:Flp pilus assembly protein TadG
MRVRNERGATIALVAVSLTALMGMGALAIDLSMLMKARGDAQRAADAGALAGASAFMNAKPHDAVDDARTRAIEFVGRNYVGGTFIDTLGQATTVTGSRSVTTSNEAVVVVIPDSEKVRVIVRRQAVGTFFGRVLGFSNVPISAKAAAIAATAGAGKCIKPFAIPDWWDDGDNDIDLADNQLEDLGNGQGKNGERWRWDSAVDRYVRYGAVSGAPTGLGSSHRNCLTCYAKGDNQQRIFYDDYGRPIVLKKSDPNQTVSPSFFQPWVLPGSGPGAADYRKNIVTCSNVEVQLNSEYTTDASADTSSYDNKPGNMIGPTKQGMDSLISLDPKACWAEFPHPTHTGYTSGEVRKLDASNNCTVDYPDWEASARVALVPLFDPALVDNGRTALKFNNLAVIFIEDQKGRHDAVVGRFMYFAKATSQGHTTGSLVKKLRLVE